MFLMGERDIMVTIRCITYNHHLYIRQCLDGIVMQKTNFRFIALVHDDASTDGTVEIINDYARRYPDIIYPLLEKENQYSKGYDRIRKLLDAHTNSKYVAICEGDDFWTDSQKLQKQFDFLEQHSEYSACFHPAMVRYEDNSQKETLSGDIEDRDYSGMELFQWNHRPPTASIFFRSEVYRSPVYLKSLKANLSFGDTPLFLSCAHEGKVRGMSEVMSVYRKHPQGMTSTFDKGSKSMLKFAADNLKIYRIFGDEYKEECVRIYVMDHINYFLLNLHHGKILLRSLIKVLVKYPCITVKFLWVRLKESSLLS